MSNDIVRAKNKRNFFKKQKRTSIQCLGYKIYHLKEILNSYLMF